MDTRKDKSHSAPVVANRRTAPRNDDAVLRHQVHVLQTQLASDSEFSIADEADFGGDPYNSTGQHVVIKAKQLHSK